MLPTVRLPAGRRMSNNLSEPGARQGIRPAAPFQGPLSIPVSIIALLLALSIGEC